jgi:hypothetical protein
MHRKNSGHIILTSSEILSNDGMSITTNGVDEAARPISNVAVCDNS